MLGPSSVWSNLFVPDQRRHTAILLIINSDHSPGNRNVIRVPPSFGLYIDLVNPIMNG